MQTTAPKGRTKSLAAMTLRLLRTSKKDERQLRYRSVRVPTDLASEWSWGDDRGKGRIKNLSSGGCYVAAEQATSVGDRVRIKLFIPNFLCVDLDGLVVRSKRGEGFAVRFRNLGATDQLLLERAVWRLSPRMRTPEQVSRRRENSGRWV